MAKMFYTMDETKVALAKNEEEIKQLSREGRLREFRDGPRLMFKADQVEQLKADLGMGGDAVNLGPSDTGAPISMIDTHGAGASGSGIALMDSQAGRTQPPPNPKEETAFADIGLSGIGSGIGSGVGSGIGSGIGGVPSPGRLSPGQSGMGMPGSPGGTKSGVTVFDVDDSQRVDPSAQTAMGGGVHDQVQLESVGSGSGLLDLTRESDDTSLGAVFDELTPPTGGRRGGPPPLMQSGASGLGIAALEAAQAPMSRPMGGPVSAPVHVEKPDPFAPAFGGLALATVVVICFGGFVLAATVMGFKPEIMQTLKENGMTYLLVSVLGIAVFGVAGLIIGKMTTR